MPKWSKSGESKGREIKTLGERTYLLIKGVCYDDEENQLEIFQTSEKDIAIRYTMKSSRSALYIECMEKRKGFTNFPVDESWSNDKRIGVVTKNNEKIEELIELIDEHNSLSEIKNEIYTFLGLKTQEELIREKVFTLLNDKEIAPAIEAAIKAQDDKHYEVIWELAEHLHSNMMSVEPIASPQCVLELYQAISKENPHYQDANNRALHLLMTQTPDTDQEKAILNENKFKCALEGRNQLLTDQLFNELSGNTGLTPELTNLKNDADTLVLIATQMKTLKAENEELKKYKKEHQDHKRKEPSSPFWNNGKEEEENPKPANSSPEEDANKKLKT